ncbi:TetR/AcrR family transcriptional regulator [Sporichthya polymorpha]|uniref:TetR/AcrR family transcriptional regulator n=1 Tax=Sporichthya polymorpha TaxID=35751 RepID=UPI000A01C4EB|nr:TetR/AcrR family transcriptional regulator [Sporichthya polymorpha]
MAPTTKRPRRASADVRELLLRAARDEFLAKGYAGATTKAIAARAEVSETVIFNQFGDKTGLFTEAFVSPFGEVVAEYLDARNDPQNSSPAERVERFVDHLSALAREYRPILIAAISHRLDGTGPAEDDLLDRLAAELQKILGIGELTEVPGFGPVGPATRASAAAMVLGMALLDDLIFPRGADRPSDARLEAEMTAAILSRLRDPDAPLSH